MSKEQMNKYSRPRAAIILAVLIATRIIFAFVVISKNYCIKKSFCLFELLYMHYLIEAFILMKAASYPPTSLNHLEYCRR